MIKKTITYTGFDGHEITEDFYFGLTEAELAEKEISHIEGYADYLTRIVRDNDRSCIIEAFKDLILCSVGVRSEDGKGFVKKGVADSFVATEAFSILFMELVTDAARSAEFFNGVMPKKLAEKMQQVSDKPETTEVRIPVLGGNTIVKQKTKTFPDDYTRGELEEMSGEEFQQLLRTLPGNNVPRDLLTLAIKKSTAK